jgi:chromosome segregation ATPase
VSDAGNGNVLLFQREMAVYLWKRLQEERRENAEILAQNQHLRERVIKHKEENKDLQEAVNSLEAEVQAYREDEDLHAVEMDRLQEDIDHLRALESIQDKEVLASRVREQKNKVMLLKEENCRLRQQVSAVKKPSGELDKQVDSLSKQLEKCKVESEGLQGEVASLRSVLGTHVELSEQKIASLTKEQLCKLLRWSLYRESTYRKQLKMEPFSAANCAMVVLRDSDTS